MFAPIIPYIPYITALGVGAFFGLGKSKADHPAGASDTSPSAAKIGAYAALGLVGYLFFKEVVKISK